MNVESAALLAVWMLGLTALARGELGSYARFKTLNDPGARRKFYARWFVAGFTIFTLASLLSLWVLGALDALFTMPPPLAALARDVGLPELDTPILVGMLAGALAGIVAGAYRAARHRDASRVIVGDVRALLPRSRAEYAWATVLSVNAGIGEEICFRLLWPLLFTNVSGSAAFAFVASALAFGALHLYQGFAGVAVTTLLGVAMTALYLVTGSIVWPMVVHALIDLRALVLHPLLVAWVRKRRRAT